MSPRLIVKSVCVVFIVNHYKSLFSLLHHPHISYIEEICWERTSDIPYSVSHLCQFVHVSLSGSIVSGRGTSPLAVLRCFTTLLTRSPSHR